MDTRAVESVLTEVAKAFRLCRFYPASHPAVQQAMTDLAAALPALAPVGAVELRIGPAGFALGTTPLLPHNPPIQEFANLLFARGHRSMTVQPGVSADEFAALIRQTAGATARSGAALGVSSAAPVLPHILLEGTARRASAAAPRPSQSGGMGATASSDAAPMGGRSSGVFRPNALPADIEAHRIAALLAVATPSGGGAIASLSRLGALAFELAQGRDFATFAEAVATLARWAQSDDPAAAEEARVALAHVLNDGTIAGMVGLAGDPRAGAEARQQALAALGALGERAVPMLFEAYVGAGDEVVRESFGRAITAAGPAAVRHLATRAAADQAAPARAAVVLLGASGAAGEAVPVVVPLVRHADAAMRRAAVAALSRLGGPDAGRQVVGALRDGDAGVRLEAARGAAQLGDRGFGPILLGRLGEEGDEVVLLALIEGLGRLQVGHAVPALADLARGAGMFQRRAAAVRIAAVRALARLGTPEALTALEPFKTDKNPEVRAAAGGAAPEAPAR